MKILITGGAGFVGSNLGIELVKKNSQFKIIAFDNLKRRGSELNIPRLKKYGIDFIHGDIRNPEDLKDIHDFDVMVECSAEPSVLASFYNPQYVISTNLTGSINCFEEARKRSAGIIFISTSRVYSKEVLNSLILKETLQRFIPSSKNKISGFSKKGISEEFPLEGTRTLYGTTKLATELILQEYIDMYGIKGIINRCAVLTGPWQMGRVDQGFVVYWMLKHVFKQQISYIGYGGKGKQVRDVLHIADFVDLIELQIKNLSSFKGEIFNVGGGENLSISLKELTNFCRDFFKTKVKIKSVKKTRKGDVPYYVTDYTKVKKTFLWEPKRSLEQTLTDTAIWVEKHKNDLKQIFGG